MSDDLKSGALGWHDTRVQLGIEMRVHFFDPDEVDARVSFVERYLPVFTRARPRLIGEPQQRQSFVAGDLSAVVDAVLEHGNGLLCLTYRHTERQFVERERWSAQVRVDAMLQSIAGAMAVAGARQQPTVALLRLGNALLHFSPGPPVLECLATSVGAARRYWNAPKAVTTAQLASFCEPRLRSLPGIGLSAPPASWQTVAGT